MKKIAFIFFLILNSCNSSNLYNDELKIINCFNGSIKLSNLSYIYIIPNNGCGTCIEKSINFMYDYHENKSIQFILVESSRKKIKNILDNLDNYNLVKIDNELMLETEGIIVSEPIIYKIKNNHLTTKTIITDSNIDIVIDKTIKKMTDKKH